MSEALNWDELLELFMGDRESVDGLIDLFVEQAEAILAAIREGIANRDTHQVQMEAHKLAGSAANIRAQEINKIAKQMELAAKEGTIDFDGVGDKLTAIQGSLKTIVAEKASA